MSIASTATRTSVSFRVMVVRSSCSASWRRFCTHISQETSRAVRRLHVIFNLHHWLWRGSSFSNIQAMDVLPSSPPWTPLKASGTPTLPEMHGKNTWLYRYANLKRYRRMLAERKQREYKMFCSFPTSPCRFSFLSTCACAASRRVASRSLHRIYMTCRPNHVSEHLLSISDLYIASPLVAAPIGALSVVCVAGGRLCYGVFHVVWVGLGVYIFM